MRIDPVAINGPQIMMRGDHDGEVIGVPIPIVATVDDGSLEWDVIVTVGLADVDDPTPVAEEITIRRRPGGPPAAAASIRGISIAAIVREAVAMAATVFTISDGPSGQTLTVSSDTPYRRPSSEEIKSATASTKLRGRTNAADPAQDDEVLRAYEAAREANIKNPYGYVAKQIGIGRSTAHLMAQRARDRKAQQ